MILGKDSAGMFDCLGTLSTTGTGWEIDDAERRMDSVESQAPSQVEVCCSEVQRLQIVQVPVCA